MSDTEVWSIIKYKPKDGCEEDFVTQHTLHEKGEKELQH